MVNPDAFTSRPPAGAEGTDVHADVLLHELRRGERDGFLRYHRLYRDAIYDLVWRLTRGHGDAVTITDEVFATAYRRVILQDGHVDLRGWTYAAALDVCGDQLAESGADAGDAVREEGRAPASRGGSASKDLGRRMTQAFEALGFRHKAVLLFHDVHGLSAAETATAFGATEDAAGVLLFRAREAFRQAFEELSLDRSPAETCRLAELAAAGAVGRGLTPDEALRLEKHAGYCRHCRRIMAGWAGGPVGLATFLEPARPPQVLETPPVFASRPVVGESRSAARVGGLSRMFGRRARRSARGKTVAYVLAAACLALSIGLAAQLVDGDSSVVVISSAGPGLSWLGHPAKSSTRSADGSRRVAASDARLSAGSAARSSAGSPASTSASSPAGTSARSPAASSVVAEASEPASAPAATVADAGAPATRPATRPTSRSATRSAARGQASGGGRSTDGGRSSAGLASSLTPGAGRAASRQGGLADGVMAPGAPHGNAGAGADGSSGHGTRALGSGSLQTTGRHHHAASTHRGHDAKRHQGHVAKPHQGRVAKLHQGHAAKRHGDKTGKKHR